MTTTELYDELNNVDHSHGKRLFYANLVIGNPDLLPKLLEILFKVEDKMSDRAAWVFEFVCRKNIELIIPLLNTFTENIAKVRRDSAVRPVAKICELVVLAYYDKADNPLKSALTNTHKERIIETCFDYMINNQKVAVKAYSMQTLYLLGKDYDWVHPELRLILERDFYEQSAAFKARARHILKKVKKG
ncbi:adenylosuccinate lyase [Flavobacteriaceae bacterium SZ-1-7]|uniref:adenylosuccinate lyase n=1 Tax=Tamlana sedimenti TaxID=3134126 RepID=UPI0031252BE7